jgi:hypothetical protein
VSCSELLIVFSRHTPKSGANANRADQHFVRNTTGRGRR